MSGKIIQFPSPSLDVEVVHDEEKLQNNTELNELMLFFAGVMARRAFMRLTEKQRRNVFDEVFRLYDYGREYDQKHKEDFSGWLIDYIKYGAEKDD